MSWVSALACRAIPSLCVFVTHFTHSALSGFGDADVEAANAHFRRSKPSPALENWIDWILSHPQPDAPAALSTPAPAPIVAVSEFEFFPRGPSPAVQPHSHVNLTCPGIDVNDVIPPAVGVRPHVPTVAKAFRERLRNDPNPATFNKELPLLWKNLFRAPPDVSRRPELLMVHQAAFEFALNELVLACEESHYTESAPIEESKSLDPLEFLKRDPSFLAFVSNQLNFTASVASVRLASCSPAHRDTFLGASASSSKPFGYRKRGLVLCAV